MSTSPEKEAARAEEPEEDAAEESSSASGGPPPDMATLVARGDADGLLELARAYRAGTGGNKKDLQKCLASYREAARLGSAEAEYSVALFYLSGGLVPQDLKEGAARLRVAADGGYLPAKVYLANLYELGVHFAADSAKADVWYRSAARAANVKGDAESEEYARAMADLGCARYCLALAEDAALPEAERERLLKKAKAYGYQLALRRDSRASAIPAVPESQAAPAALVAEAPAPAVQENLPKEEPRVQAAPKAKARPAPGGGIGAALAAFFYASLFLAASIAAGYFLTLGAGELLHRGVNLSVLAAHPHAVFPAVVVLFGVLPAFLMYRFLTVVRASAFAGLLGAAGYALWGASGTTLLPDQELQAILFGAAGFLGALLVLGLLGGVKPKKPPPPRILT